MSKKIRKIFTYLLLTVLAVVGLGNVVNVSAEGTDGGDPVPADPKTNVVITKVETGDDPAEMTLEQLEKGVDVASYFKDGKVLPGVSFTWYSVTADQLETLTAPTASYDTVAKVDALVGENTGTTTEETDTNGQVTISDLPEGNYWIVENTKGTIVSSRAVPFALTLPFTNQTRDGWLKEINVYPKNTLQDEPDVPVKTIDESNNAIGEEHTWTISQNIPVGIEEYHEFKFTDAIDSRLDWVGNVEVTAADVNLVLDTDYTVDFNDEAGQSSNLLLGKDLTGILTVDFTDTGLAKLAGATGPIEITFQTKINDTAIMGEPIENNVQVDFDNGHGRTVEKTPDEVPSVHSGGKKFVKVDQANEELLLAGAEFKIKNPAGDFVIIGTDGAVTFGAEADAKLFTSAEAGTFEIKGLPYGEYILVETKARDGYALPTDPNTSFTVNADSYKDAAVLKIDNKEITIPQTGGIGTAIFTMIGAALMIFATVYYKRTSNA